MTPQDCTGMLDLGAVIAGDRQWAVVCGNCLDVIPAIPPEFRQIVAADPPYGYGHYKTDKDVTAQMLAAVAGWRTLALKGYAQDLHAWLMDAGIKDVVEWVTWFPTNHAAKAGGRWEGLAKWHEDWACSGELPGRKTMTRVRALSSISPAIQRLHRADHKTGSEFTPAKQGDVWTDQVGAGFLANKRIHPNETALGVQLKLVELISNPGDTILDPFAGSFSLGVAAIRLGRSYIGIEIDAAWAEQGRERMQAEQEGSTLQARRQGQIPLFAGGVK